MLCCQIFPIKVFFHFDELLISVSLLMQVEVLLAIDLHVTEVHELPVVNELLVDGTAHVEEWIVALGRVTSYECWHPFALKTNRALTVLWSFYNILLLLFIGPLHRLLNHTAELHWVEN